MNGGAILAAAWLSAASAVAAADGARDAPRAQEHLLSILADERKAPAALAALRSTGDRDLVPLFAALSWASARRSRIMGAAGLASLKGPQALEALRLLASKGPGETVRTQALAELLALGAANTELLVELSNSPPEGVRLLAARELAMRGRGPTAAEALAKLTASANARTAAMARMSLLGLGQREQYEPLAKALRDPATPARTVELLLRQIAEEKIAAAGDLARRIAACPDRADRLRLIAYRAVAAAEPQGPDKLLEAIHGSDRTVFRVYLFRILAAVAGQRRRWASLAKDKGAVGALARFELARPGGGPAAARAATAALALEHPVVVVHVLDRAKEDIDALGPAAQWYAAVLLGLIHKVPSRLGGMRWADEAAGRAATLLGDLGTPEALKGLRSSLAGRNRREKRAVVGGLLITGNRAAALLAEPLLDSPYDELATTAALVLGRFGEPAAAGRLRAVVRYPHRYRSQVVTMACWYLLKIRKQGRRCVEQLVRQVK